MPFAPFISVMAACSNHHQPTVSTFSLASSSEISRLARRHIGAIIAALPYGNPVQSLRSLRLLGQTTTFRS